jgi:hypothetical protein
MDRVFTDEKVIPNDTLRKLLEGTLESKINTSILEKDKVIDVELSRAETDFFVLGDEDTSEDTDETSGGHSWQSLRKKLVAKEEDEVSEAFSKETLNAESKNTREDSAESDSSYELSEVKNYFKAISASSAQITQEVKKLSEHLSKKEQIRKTEEGFLDSPLFSNDPFDSKLIFLLFGVMTLGLVIGLVLGVTLLRIL